MRNLNFDAVELKQFSNEQWPYRHNHTPLTLYLALNTQKYRKMGEKRFNLSLFRKTKIPMPNKFPDILREMKETAIYILYYEWYASYYKVLVFLQPLYQ